MSSPPNPYKHILESGRDGITINSGRMIVYVNESFAKMTGYSVDELIGMDIFHLTASEYWENVEERTRLRQAGDQVESQYELELVRKDGTRFPVEFSVAHIEFEGNSSSLTIVRDISERKQTENALIESEERLSLFMQSSTDSITIFDQDMRFVEVNNSWLQMTGHNREDVIGKHILDVYTRLKETGRYDAYLKVLETGEITKYHAIEVVSTPGRDIVLDVSAFKTGDNLGIVARDVSDQVMYQRRLEALHSHAAELASLDSKEAVAYLTMEIIRGLLGFKIGSFGFIDDGKIVFTEFREESSVVELDLDGPGITVRAVNMGETQLVQDTRKEPDYISGRFKEDEETLSELDVPIKVRGSVVALINLESNHVGAFQEDDQRLVETLGMHVSSSLNRLNRENVIKKTLDELKASEELFRGFMQSATERFVMFDEALCFVEVNKNWLQRADLMREDVIGKQGLEVFPELKETGQYDVYLKVLETGEPVELRAVESVTKQGAILNISAFKAGEFLGVIARDISELVVYRRRLEALNEHVIKLSTLFTIDEVIGVTFKIIEEIFGNTFGSFGIVEGENIHHINVPGFDHSTEFTQPINGPGICARAVRTGVNQVVNETRDDPDFIIATVEGIYEPRSELVVPIRIEGKIVAVLNVESILPGAFSSNDVRLVELLANHAGSALYRLRAAEERFGLQGELFKERVRGEQEQELGQLKTRFMSTATHEIRTPLASIQGYTELIQLEDGTLSEAQREYFEVIQRNVRRLTVLTDDLLDLQRLEEGRMSVSLEPVNVSVLLELVKSEFSPILAEKNQRLVVSGVDVVLNMDRLRVMQVLVNLLSNASKFSSDGSEIRVDVVASGEDVLVSVSDDGIGIGEENISKLFNPFPGILVDGNVRGTGLGLAICKGIVEMHDGEIWVDSEGLGKGSTFSFKIPNK